MSDSLIHVRLGKRLKDEMNELIGLGWFSNQAELIREGIRELVLGYRREEAIKNLEKQRGILKGKGKGLTLEIRNKLAAEHTPEESKKILRKFGFD